MLPPLQRSIEFGRTRIELWSSQTPQSEDFADRLGSKDSARDRRATGRKQPALPDPRPAFTQQDKPRTAELVRTAAADVLAPVWTLETVDAEIADGPLWLATGSTTIAQPAGADAPGQPRSGRTRPDVARLYARSAVLGRPEESAVGVLLKATA